MANHPQGESVAPRVPVVDQCPGCPPGNSLPLVAGEQACGIHVWWAADSNGAAMNTFDEE